MTDGDAWKEGERNYLMPRVVARAQQIADKVRGACGGTEVLPQSWVGLGDRASKINIFVKREPVKGEPRKMAFQWGKCGFVEV